MTILFYFYRFFPHQLQNSNVDGPKEIRILRVVELRLQLIVWYKLKGTLLVNSEAPEENWRIG
jgi:hypothetical protein